MSALQGSWVLMPDNLWISTIFWKDNFTIIFLFKVILIFEVIFILDWDYINFWGGLKKLSIFDIQIAAAEKNWVKFYQKSVGEIRRSLSIFFRGACPSRDRTCLWVCQSHFFQPWHEITRYGPVRYCMVLYGPLWSYMVPYGPLWSHMVPYGPIWSRMVPYGPVLYCMVLYGTVWHQMVLFGPVGSRWYCMVP